MDKNKSLFLCLLIVVSACVQPPKTDVRVHFISVGLGDSTFIDTPGKDVLIDGGDCGAGNGVVAYLKSINVTRIDLLVASHHDSDHVCGLIPVLQAFNVSEVWDKGSQTSQETQTFTKYLQQASKKNLKVAGRGDWAELAEGVQLQVLSPSQPLGSNSENDNSLVLKLVAGGRRFLFPGDCEARCEAGMLWSLQDMRSDVLKVGHHGSRDATGQLFLMFVNPTVAVVEVGPNQYGFPQQETLQRLESKGVKVYRTDVDGSIIIHTDGTVLEKEPTR